MNRPGLAPTPRSISLAANVALGGAALYYWIQNGKSQSREAMLRHEATHDSLTGLLNSRGLEQLLANNEPPRAMLYIDSTNLKAVNDKIGHDRGNEAIKGTARVIQRSLRPNDVAARIGGDEFLVLLSPDQREEDLIYTNDEILKVVSTRLSVESQAFLDLDENQDLKAVGLHLAVGGAVWEAGMSIVDLRQAAETNMGVMKADQHRQFGQWRAP